MDIRWARKQRKELCGWRHLHGSFLMHDISDKVRIRALTNIAK